MNQLPNFSWLYYRQAFQVDADCFENPDRHKDDLKRHHARIARKMFVNLPANGEVSKVLLGQSDFLRPAKHIQNISLVTIYPGMLTGSGYNHEASLGDGEFKLGFQLDHTTGLPVVPGSSVKGKLRSFFPHSSTKKEDEALRADKRQFMTWFMAQENKEHTGLEWDGNWPTISGHMVDRLEWEIFEGRIVAEDKKPDSERQLDMYHTDVFHDAVPVSILGPNYENETRLFGDDYITPHKHDKLPELDPFTNPVPIKFLKVMPGVVFRFQFRLHDGKMLTALQKQALFRALLLWGGIGAKTNVGYGQLVAEDKYMTPAETATPSHYGNREPEVQAPEVKKPGNDITQDPEVEIPAAYLSIKKNDVFTAEVTEQTEKYNYVSFNLGKDTFKLRKAKDKNPELNKGDKVKVTFKNDFLITPTNPNFQISKL